MKQFKAIDLFFKSEYRATTTHFKTCREAREYYISILSKKHQEYIKQKPKELKAYFRK